MAAARHNTPALPDQTPVLSPLTWGQLHDLLVLSLDALGDEPAEFTEDFLANAVMHQRRALKITHAALRRLGGEA